MQEVYIPADRIKKLKTDEGLKAIERASGCRLKVNRKEDFVEIDGDGYSEFLAKNMLTAFGRGFGISTACLLASEDYYFSYIDLGRSINSEKRIEQVKARIIGEHGKAKKYIESVSSAHISVYGNTVGFIGEAECIKEAEVAVETIIAGSTHKLAYSRMEALHRKNHRLLRDASF
ncbi:KH type 1 domain protein [mine drainage metagenome]|uniref:KH type 1 domain protein n=1 Tax=mine drainage metagenome TaxID=410659 RepID=T0YRU8_9ZZZZ